MSHRRSRTTALAAALLVLSACGSSGDEGASDSDATSPSASATPSSASPSASADTSPQAASVAITIKGDQISPRTKQVSLKRNEPVTLEITSDRAGELHIHSTPEQEIGFEAGTTTKTLRFATPGVIDVEEHESDTLLVQFQVR